MRVHALLLLAVTFPLAFSPPAARVGNRQRQSSQKKPPLIGRLKDGDLVDLCGCTFGRETGTPGDTLTADAYMQTAWINIDGEDVKLKLTRRGGSRRGLERIGSRYTEWFAGKGADGVPVRVSVNRIVNELCRPYGPQCETTGYRMTITATKGARTHTVRGRGVCGCV